MFTQTALLLVFVVSLVVQRSWRVLSSYRTGIPSVFLSRFSRLWLAREIAKGDFHWTNIRLHQQKGPLVQLAPGYYSIADPSTFKAVYGHTTKFEKSKWYDSFTFHPDLSMANLFSERNTARHAAKRRKLAAMYSMSSLVSYEGFVDECIEILRQKLENFSSTGEIVDLGHWLQCYAFDVIGNITFGQRFGFLDNGEDIGSTMLNLEQSNVIFSELGLFLGFRPSFLYLSSFMKSPLDFIEKFIQEKIAQVKQSGKLTCSDGPTSMTAKLCESQEAQKDLTDFDVYLGAAANVAAGSDTTSISLAAVFFYLHRSPNCLRKVLEEMDEAKLSRNPFFKDVQKLPYLQAAIKEALRLSPAVGLPLFREVPKGGIVLSGKFLPEKSNIGVNIWVAHRDPAVFGLDADVYRPERWLEAEAAVLSVMEQNYMPFGLGSRMCIGKNISLLEINKLVPALLRDFDFDFTENPGRDMRAKNKFFVKPTHLKARIIRRRATDIRKSSP